MGDHRADIKIELSMYGKTKHVEMSINWSPESWMCDLDARVIEWFQKAVEELSVHFEVERDRREQERLEREERALYEQLKAKYEP